MANHHETTNNKGFMKKATKKNITVIGAIGITAIAFLCFLGVIMSKDNIIFETMKASTNLFNISITGSDARRNQRRRTTSSRSSTRIDTTTEVTTTRKKKRPQPPSTRSTCCSTTRSTCCSPTTTSSC
jgi:hypothetical protein